MIAHRHALQIMGFFFSEGEFSVPVGAKRCTVGVNFGSTPNYIPFRAEGAWDREKCEFYRLFGNRNAPQGRSIFVILTKLQLQSL